ncbi:MAG: GNAT family N-acetyltransferase [Bacteroidota bacterium]
MYQPYCRIVPLDRYNWEQCIHIEALPEQRNYIPSVLFSLAQAKFENLHPFGIQVEGEMVGFMMYGEFSGICWINRVIVDAKHHRKGIGRAAVQQLIERLRTNIHCKEIRASFSKENHIAREFFQAAGFTPLSDALPDEEVVVYEERV